MDKPAWDSFGCEKYDGTTVTINGVPFVVPALSAGTHRRMRDAISKVTNNTATNAEAEDTAMSVILSALRRNYPEITAEYLEDEVVDAGNRLKLLQLVLNLSGYKQGNAEAGSRLTSTS